MTQGTDPAVVTRDAAQRRADRIRAFREELHALEADGILLLGRDDRERLSTYHTDRLAQLATLYDVDRSDAERQLSLGMRLVSLLGAVALTASIALFLERIWGALPTPAQVGIVWILPLVLLGAMSLVARRERTRYFTSLLGLLAFGCFIVNVAVVGTIFNARESALPFLAWSVFALALAYRWDLPWLLGAGAATLIAFCTGGMAWAAGHPIDIGLQRPEVTVLAGLAVFASSVLRVNASRGAFPEVLRGVGLVAACLALILLTEWGGASYLRLERAPIERVYQVVAFAVAAGALWVGIRRGWRETSTIGTVFFALFLLLRFYDWFWAWMPKYLFFLLVGLVALSLLLAFRRLRRT